MNVLANVLATVPVGLLNRPRSCSGLCSEQRYFFFRTTSKHSEDDQHGAGQGTSQRRRDLYLLSTKVGAVPHIYAYNLATPFS